MTRSVMAIANTASANASRRKVSVVAEKTCANRSRAADERQPPDRVGCPKRSRGVLRCRLRRAEAERHACAERHNGPAVVDAGERAANARIGGSDASNRVRNSHHDINALF